MSTDTAHIGRRMAKGAAWTVSMRLAIRSLGLVSTVILARLLVPEDFGLVALAMTLFGLLEAMSEFSFAVTLIRDQKADRRHYDTVWTLSVARGVAVAILLVVLAAPVAGFFDEPRVEAIVYCLALAAAVSGLQNVGVVDFQKEMRFHKDFFFMTAEKLGAFAVTVTLAFMWREYWALIVGIVAAKFFRVALSYAMHDYRPRFSLAAWREVINFSKWLLLNNIFSYFFFRADNLMVGKLLGAGSLGVYSIAHEIANLVTTELVMPIRRAIFPGYAKLAADPVALSKNFLDTLSIIAMVALPFAAGLGLVADPLVRLFLGEKWLAAIPLIQLLVIHGAMNVMSSLSGTIYLTLGKPHYLTLVFVTGVIVLVPLIYWGVSASGIMGAALAVTAASTVTATIDMTLATRLLRISPRRLAAATWRTIVALAVMGGSVYAAASLLPTGGEWVASAGNLAVRVTVGAAAYVTAHLTLWTLSGMPEGAETHLLAILRRSRPAIAS